VYPREVEDVLRTHPVIIDAAVVGTPSAEWGEVVTAFVEATDDFDAESIQMWAADHLVAYKRPRIVRRVATLPRNALGKVQRDQLTS
jgi:acyl-CoA synthetase (AMP-forming)/AMP-acid ligase II